MSTPADNSSGGEKEREKELDPQVRAGNRRWGVGTRSRSCEFKKAVGRASKV